ncbi:MAG: hypothetical protein ACLQDQ_01965 [Myxococcaceae bacterium]
MGRRVSLVAVLFAVGAVLLPTSANAIPAFARKYGVACSACHTNWPRLNRFGINFRDNGYRMNRERDNPVTQNGAYWPIAFRATVGYLYQNNTLVPVQPSPSDPNGLATTETGTFGYAGLDILTAGTLGEQIGFLLVVEAQLDSSGYQTGTQEGNLESAWIVFTRLLGTPYLNLRVGKGALTDLPNDQHRSYQLTVNYQILLFTAPGSAVTFTPSNNFAGVEFFGHNELDNFRYDLALVNGVNPFASNVWFSANVVSNPTLWSHISYFALTGSDIVASVEAGVFGATGWAPTKGLTVAGATSPCVANSGNNCVSGTGSDLANFYRIGGDLHFQFLSNVNPLTLDGAVEFGSDSAPLIAGAGGNGGQNLNGTPTQAANWLGGYVELSYTPDPNWTVALLYNRVVMLQQGSTDYSPATGDFDSWDVLVRYNLAFSSRAAIAFQAEFSQSATTQVQGTLPPGMGPPLGTAFLLGLDFAY